MAKKKSPAAAKQQPTPKKQAPAARRSPKTTWIVIAVAAVVILGMYAASRGSGPASADKAPVATAEEAKYIGRFLPASYQPPQVSDGGAISADTPMTPIQASAEETSVSLAVSEVTAARNVAFEYTREDGEKMPMIAYVKPSGKLFVGVSYCVPCKGTGQTLTTDGMMTCDACGTKRDPESGVGISGACKLYPLDELPVTVEGDRIVIDKDALENWTVQPTDRQVG